MSCGPLDDFDLGDLPGIGATRLVAIVANSIPHRLQPEFAVRRLSAATAVRSAGLALQLESRRSTYLIQEAAM